jgi:uridine phosphorylase
VEADNPTRSAASPWRNDRPPHLPCARGELPRAVLFPGDPGRVDRFATILDDFRILGQNREFRIGVGTYKGRELGVCSTGIGGPSTEIALVEAAELGCRFALRVGGTGALDPEIPLGSLLIVTEALRLGGAAAQYAPANVAAKADPTILSALEIAAQRLGIITMPAIAASVDGYYAAQARLYPGANASLSLARYIDRGATTIDMEAETILVVGASVGLAAGALLAVHANRAIDQWLEDFGPAQDAMIRVACEALSHLS